jgi:hypothetical protein
MKQYFFSLLFSSLFALLLFSSEASAQINGKPRKHPLVHHLTKVDRALGCDCKLQTLKESRNDLKNRFVFQADLSGIPAWMNIDGRDVELKLIYASLATKGVTLGSRSHKKYRAKGISVVINYIVNAVCPEENPDCDSVGYAATITVTKGSRTQTIKASGMCGWC